VQATTVLQWPDKPILTFQSCSNPSTAAKNSRSRREVFANARIGKWRSEFPCLDSDIHNGTVPFGRRKGQRNLSTALIGMVHQTVTVKEGDK
jgi:hypothetical protein